MPHDNRTNGPMIHAALAQHLCVLTVDIDVY